MGEREGNMKLVKLGVGRRVGVARSDNNGDSLVVVGAGNKHKVAMFGEFWHGGEVVTITIMPSFVGYHPRVRSLLVARDLPLCTSDGGSIRVLLLQVRAGGKTKRCARLAPRNLRIGGGQMLWCCAA